MTDPTYTAEELAEARAYQQELDAKLEADVARAEVWANAYDAACGRRGISTAENANDTPSDSHYAAAMEANDIERQFEESQQETWWQDDEASEGDERTLS